MCRPQAGPAGGKGKKDLPGARRGALPLAVFIVALLTAGIVIAFIRGGDDTPQADDSPTPDFTITTTTPPATNGSPTPTGTTPTTSPTMTETPTESPTVTETPTESPTTSPAGTVTPTSVPTSPTVLPTTPDGGDLPRTGMPVAGWLFGGILLMVASTALMRALSRHPA